MVRALVYTISLNKHKTEAKCTCEGADRAGTPTRSPDTHRHRSNAEHTLPKIRGAEVCQGEGLSANPPIPGPGTWHWGRAAAAFWTRLAHTERKLRLVRGATTILNAIHNPADPRGQSGTDTAPCSQPAAPAAQRGPERMLTRHPSTEGVQPEQGGAHTAAGRS